MNNRILKKLGTTIALLVVLAIAGVYASGQLALGGTVTSQEKAIEKLQRANRLEGVWELTITFRNCESGEALRTRPGLISFLRGGVMQEFGAGSAPLDRTDAQGVWRHENERTFLSTAKFFRFAADGAYAGSAKLYRQIELSTDGSRIEAKVESEIFDAGGALIARGCATEEGTRLE